MFTKFARWAARALGTSKAFGLSMAAGLLWLVIGPLLDPELSWRGLLLVNLPTLFTLLMVFLVQHTQNHHNDAVQAKLDELIRAVEGAHNVMVHVEELSPDELVRVRSRYKALADRVKAAPGGAEASTNTPEVEATLGPLVVLGADERAPRGK